MYYFSIIIICRQYSFTFIFNNDSMKFMKKQKKMINFKEFLLSFKKNSHFTTFISFFMTFNYDIWCVAIFTTKYKTKSSKKFIKFFIDSTNIENLHIITGTFFASNFNDIGNFCINNHNHHR